MNKLILISLIILFSVPAIAEYPEWKWESEMPKHFFIFGPPATERNSDKFEEVFKQFRGPIKYKNIVRNLGRADHYSPQIIYSLKQGVPPNPNQSTGSSGTYRYLLEDGGEVHIWVLPGDIVGTAIRYEKNGSGHLLYK